MSRSTAVCSVLLVPDDTDFGNDVNFIERIMNNGGVIDIKGEQTGHLFTVKWKLAGAEYSTQFDLAVVPTKYFHIVFTTGGEYDIVGELYMAYNEDNNTMENFEDWLYCQTGRVYMDHVGVYIHLDSIRQLVFDFPSSFLVQRREVAIDMNTI